MAEEKASNPGGQATKQALNMMLNAASSSSGMTGPIIGAVVALIVLVVGLVVAMTYATTTYYGLLRHLQRNGHNGGALNSLTTVMSSGTIYVNLVYPSGSECTSKYGGAYVFKKDTTEVTCGSVSAAQRADTSFKIGIKLGNTFYEGTAAANDLDVFAGGAKYPGSPTAAQGTTNWLYIPGYHNGPTGAPTTGVPVIDVIHNTSTTSSGPNGEDLTLRFDLGVKNAAEGDAIVTAWKANNNCQKSQPGLYRCAVTGVTVKYGKQNNGPTSALSNEAEGQFTGDFPVDQSLRLPTSLIGPSETNINDYYAKPTYIVLHYLGEADGGRLLTAQAARQYFYGSVTDGSGGNNKYVQFIVSKDGTIHQLLAETKKAAGTCGFNLMPDGIGISISIENEGNFDLGAKNTSTLGFTDQPANHNEVDSNIKLIKYLMNKWHIPKGNVVTHGWAWQNYGKNTISALGSRCEQKSDPGNAFYQEVMAGL